MTTSHKGATSSQANITNAILAYGLVQNHKLITVARQNNELLRKQAELTAKIGDAQLDLMQKQLLLAESEERRKGISRVNKQLIFELKLRLDEANFSETNLKKFWIASEILKTIASYNLASSSFDEIQEKEYFTSILKSAEEIQTTAFNGLSSDENDALSRIRSNHERLERLHLVFSNILVSKRESSRKVRGTQEPTKNKDFITMKRAVIISIILFAWQSIVVVQEVQQVMLIIGALILIYPPIRGSKRILAAFFRSQDKEVNVKISPAAKALPEADENIDILYEEFSTAFEGDGTLLSRIERFCYGLKVDNDEILRHYNLT